MTYVSDMNSAELHAHMKRLQKMEGWHDPLADRLFAELEKVNADRSACWAEFKALRRSADENEKYLREELKGVRAELYAIKAQEPVAFYWQDVGYPDPHKHGPYFGWPNESALRAVDGGAIPVPLFTMPPAKADEVSVPVDFLKQIIAEWEHDNDKYGLARELRALLASGKEQP